MGGMLSSLVHVLIVTPLIWTMIKKWGAAVGPASKEGPSSSVLTEPSEWGDDKSGERAGPE